MGVEDLGGVANPMFKLKGPAMIKGSYAPAFPLKHQQKDMRLALALGDEHAVSMPVAATANEVPLSLFLALSLSTFAAKIYRYYRAFVFSYRHSRKRGALDWGTLIFQLYLRR